MQAKAMVKIHNRFDIVVRDVESGEIVQKAQAENIVLDRMYTRLLNFQSYFDRIVFGKGTGTPTVNRTTLFDRIDSKVAVTDQVIRAYPTSIWTRKITLGTEEFNGNILTEVGISDTTTNINTHAMITDAEGNPLSVDKTNIRIVDIYATVFIEIYDVDTGLFWYGYGLRNYLTGVGTIGNVLGISNLKEYEIETFTGTRTIDTANKTVAISGRFNVGALNKDVRFLYWMSAGLICEVPRPNLFEGKQINDLNIGIGDGVNNKFNLKRSPNTPIENLAIMVDGAVVDFSYHPMGIVTTNVIPATGAIVTTNYKSMYFPKTIDNVLDISFKIGFGLGRPAPVVPPPELVVPGIVPGPTEILAGDDTRGFFGEVLSEDLINGVDLTKYLGLIDGTNQNSNTSWLKFALDSKILFVAKATIRHDVSWNAINAIGAAFGGKEITINGNVYSVRLLSSAEWDSLIQPVHKDGINPRWYNYNDTDLLIVTGNINATWTSTPAGSNRIIRGGGTVSGLFDISPNSNSRFRPVLEFLYTLP